ncbi:C40 family peptidase [Corynebacterium sp. 335C]
MGKHHRITKRTRNIAVAGTTVVAATALAVPAAVANPLNDAINAVESVAGSQLPGSVSDVIDGGQLQEAIGGQGETFSPVQAVSAGQQIVSAARSKIGSPYVWGAAGPNQFDCSGLTSWAYQQVGKSIPRTSQEQAASGQRVGQGAEQPGDIIAFYGGATHVGIYSGGGNVVHAPQAGDVVKEVPMSYMPYHSAVRF